MSAQLESMVREFTSQLKDTIRAHVVDEIQRAVAQMIHRGRAKRLKAMPAAKVRAGGKRTPKQIEVQAAKLFDYIKANPGQRAEQTASGLRMDTGASVRCGSCGARSEADGDHAPEEVRELMLRTNGRWRLLITAVGPTAAEVVRPLSDFTGLERAEGLRRVPTPNEAAAEGTRTEMDGLAERLSKAGALVRIERADEDPAKVALAVPERSRTQ